MPNDLQKEPICETDLTPTTESIQPGTHLCYHLLPLILTAVVAVTFLFGMIFFLFCTMDIRILSEKMPSSLTALEKNDENLREGSLLNPDAEVRGIYIASVANLNFPSKPGLSPEEMKNELDSLVENCLSLGLNTIYFQVHPQSDALYKSELFPTASCLSGKQGDPLVFDPLAYLLEKAHENDLRLHAWVNPLRITIGSASYPTTDPRALDPKNPAFLHPEWTVAYADGRLYYDCGLPEVRKLLADCVSEIVTNYDVDGILFDDYFYPYPVYESGTAKLADFDDGASFAEYGGGLSRDDWRRENVNQLIESCYHAIKKADPECLFTVAPFGIWQNDNGKNGGSQTRGLDSYSVIYCDALAWVEGGYIDCLAPQIYWNFDSQAAPYGVLVDWWSEKVSGTKIRLLVSHGIYNYETESDPEGELTAQIEYAREKSRYRGSILYGYASLTEDVGGLLHETKEVFSKEIVYAEIEETEPVRKAAEVPVRSDKPKMMPK